VKSPTSAEAAQLRLDETLWMRESARHWVIRPRGKSRRIPSVIIL